MPDALELHAVYDAAEWLITSTSTEDCADASAALIRALAIASGDPDRFGETLRQAEDRSARAGELREAAADVLAVLDDERAAADEALARFEAAVSRLRAAVERSGKLGRVPHEMVPEAEAAE